MSKVPEALARALAPRYLLERELGQGGMATVYLALDQRHGRQVAIKVLRPELAAVIGAERFLAEIRTTAALQHPHILPLFDSGEAVVSRDSWVESDTPTTHDSRPATFLYYAMPYVEGESLRDRLRREKQLPVADAVGIAAEAASALDYAHRHGVIHRDIKPENILLHDGQALVADFGIALAISRAGDSRMTQTGLTLGTPQYMSPEQAAGERDLTPRSDVYSLAVVTYEMLAGEPPFTGPTAQAVAARVLTQEPLSLRARRSTVSAAVEAAVMQALQKLPADRYGRAAEFAQALQAERASVSRVPPPAESRIARWFRTPSAGWLVGLAAVVAAAVAAWRQPRTAARAQVVRFGVDLPSPARLSPVSPYLVFSPDGRTLVISVDVEGDNQLYRLPLETGRPVPIQGATDARPPAFSPDGRWLAFVRGADLVKVAAEGGTPIALTASAGVGVTWIDDRTIVYNRKYNQGLWRISAEGGEPQLVTRPDSTAGELGHWWPQALPGGRAVLYTAYGPSAAQARIEAVDLRTGKRTTLVRQAIFGRYLPDGHLAFFRDGNILAMPFDARRLEVTGDAVPLLQRVAIGRLTAAPVFAVSSDGTLAWAADSEYVTPKLLLWLDETGHERPALPERGAYSNVRLSPDGGRIAFALDQGTADVWVADLASGIRTRITSGPGVARFPLWSPDGRRVYYQLEHGAFDIYGRDADAGDTAVLVARSRFDKYPGAITPDGRWLLAMEDSLHERLVMLPLVGGATPRELLPGASGEESPAVSPDGRWLAYASNASGQWQVRVAPMGESGSRQVTEQTMTSSPADRGWIRWADAGRQLLFVSGDSIMRLPFDPRTGAAGTPRLALRTPYHVEDVSRDGRRFLVTKPVDAAAPHRIDLVLHWLQEIDRSPGR